MKDQEIIGLLEEATGLSLNEEKVKGLIDQRIAAVLRKAAPQRVGLGQPEAGARLGLSRFLGEVRRRGMGQEAGLPGQAELTRVEPARVKDLREGATSAGGYLVPAEQAAEVLNLVPRYSAIKSLCREVPMTAHQINFPTVAGGIAAYWVPEAADTATHGGGSGVEYGEVPRSEPTFGQLALTAHVLAVRVVVSNQLLDDSDPGVDQVLAGLFAETLGQAFDVACLRGAGTSGDPIRGLATQVTTNALTAAETFGFDDLADLVFRIYQEAPFAAQVPILGHPKAEKVLMKLKDQYGDYLYRQPGQPRAEGEAYPRVWGEPFVRDPNILTNLGTGTNQTRLFAGDFAGSALVGVRQGLVIKTNPFAEPYFSFNQTAFLAEARLGFDLATEKRFAVLGGVPTA